MYVLYICESSSSFFFFQIHYFIKNHPTYSRINFKTFYNITNNDLPNVPELADYDPTFSV